MSRDVVWQFVRLQKTAGASFLRHLQDVFPGDVACPHHFEYQLSDDANLENYRLFVGHMSVAGLKKYVNATNLIFLLRDPAERLISCYYYWREQAAKNSESKFFRMIAELSFYEFLTSENALIRNAIFNAQARLLAGGTFGSDNHTRTNIIGPDLPVDAIMANARKALREAYFVGITENLEASVERLYRKMGHPPPVFVRRDNIGKARQRAGAPDAAIMREIERNTVLDREIYVYARALFDEGAS